MSNGGKEQKKTKPKPKPVCSCPREGHSQVEKKGSTWFLTSPKATNRNRSVFSINISKEVQPSRQVTLICPICQKPNLNLTSSVTDGFYTVGPDSWLKFQNGNHEVPVFVYLYMCYRCVALPKLICERALFNWLKEN